MGVNQNGTDIALIVGIARRIAGQSAAGVQSIVFSSRTGDNLIYTVTLTDGSTTTLTIPVDNQYNELFLLASGSTDPNDNGNFRVIIDGPQLEFQRREGGAWVSRGEIGSSITTDKYILEDNTGRLVFIAPDTTQHTLVKSSIDRNGAVMGNIFGRCAFINNGELLEFRAGDPLDISLNDQDDETQTTDDFSIDLTSSRDQAIEEGIITLANVPANTRVRLSIQNSFGELIDESVNEFDFNQGLAGQVVTNGENTVSLVENIGISTGFVFTLRLQFSNTVDILGSTIDLGDGRGPRFVPEDRIESIVLIRSVVLTTENAGAQINALTGDNRVSYNSLQDAPTIPTVRTDQELYNFIKAVVLAGDNVTITADDTNRTLTINAAEVPPDPINPTDDNLFSGLIQGDTAGEVDPNTLTTTDITGAGQEITLQTGVTAANDRFVIMVPTSHAPITIQDTILNQDVTSIFATGTRTINTVSYTTYLTPPLNAGGNESYIVTIGGA